ncbi:hypothetical protein CP532_6509 [Ophiocordyceps camponoti-leonardi (nom. inval.)]|nr:hypothetical protein CP532_6509 [Ophiocordyceps camponoti-leonardi (nom. inval.)]
MRSKATAGRTAHKASTADAQPHQDDSRARASTSSARRRGSALSNTTTSASVFSSSSSSTGLTVPDRIPSSSSHDRDVPVLSEPFLRRFNPNPDDSHGSSTSQSRPPPARRDDLTCSQAHWSPHTPVMESLTIAVIGSSSAGKSTFIQTVLGLPRRPISDRSTVRINVDDAHYPITLLELDLASFDLNGSRPITWPKQVNGHILPRADAALLLYDVTNKESIRGFDKILAAFIKANLPTVLIACKCDCPDDDLEIDADKVESHPTFKPCAARYQTARDRPNMSREGLRAAVRSAVAHRRDETSDAALRRRAQSATNLEAPDATIGRPLSRQSRHSRASSDASAARAFSDAQPAKGPRPAGARGGNPVADPFVEVDEEDEDEDEDEEDEDESDEDSDDDSDDGDEIPILQRGEDDDDDDDNMAKKKSKPVGVSFSELVDRLLALPLSKADNNFSDIFLCLYRKLAAPAQLFSAILVRLDRVRDDKESHYLSKTATQFRIIEVVAKWVSLYPGDFARPATRRNLEDFITNLSTEPVFAMASQQMRRNLRLNVMVDDDTGWAHADDAGDAVASKILSKDLSQLSDGISALQFGGEADGRPSHSSDASAPEMGSIASSQLMFNSHDDYEREAAMLEPRDHQPMNKFRYRIFMDISDDDIADELTRIDWIMFSSIRIRDFVRHVSLSAAEKEKCTSMRNISRMIRHFNHVAKWVANMILLRDKAKHRAQMLEKFMNIALKLRQLNNYNGLAAVLAGINGTAIHRLTQTRALVPAEVQKRFAGLVILMGTQKSHFAYRLAWENSPLPRIPLMPLHRRDLVSAEEGSKTFVGPDGDRINWKKFEVLGEVLLPIMKSQGTAYPNLTKHDTARDLILCCRMPTDEEVSFARAKVAKPKTKRSLILWMQEIYQRSVQVESGTSGPVESGKKKFPWFAIAQQLGRLARHRQSNIDGPASMTHATIPLPTTRVAGRASNVQVSVDGSLLLRLPEDSAGLTTCDDLLELVETRHAWICRTGACHVGVTVCMDGEPLALPDETPLADWFGECELWQRLGLRLQYCGVERTGASDEMIFSLQHPDLSSALAAPKGASSIEFMAWTCRVDVCFEKPSKGRKQRRCSSSTTAGTKKKKSAKTCPAVITTDNGDEDYLYRCLTPSDRKAVDDFLSSMSFEAGGDVGRLVASSSVRDAVQLAIGAVVCGRRKSLGGVAVLKSSRAHCLVRLAPAVFHIAYLKASDPTVARAVSDRAKLLPTIATSLARMMHAESPGLRQAVESLGGPSVEAKSMERAEVLLSAIRAPSLPRKPAEDDEVGADSRYSDEPDTLPTVVSHFGPVDRILSTESQSWDFGSLASQSSYSSESCSSPTPYAYPGHYHLPLARNKPEMEGWAAATYSQHEAVDGILTLQSDLPSEYGGSPMSYAYPSHCLSSEASEVRTEGSGFTADAVQNNGENLALDPAMQRSFEDWLSAI